ncbi:MAG: hypothetical protein FJW92_02490 [Actinobacteria bacterium]|nr:hypothetical protein [Actinomycetota bacterium]
MALRGVQPRISALPRTWPLRGRAGMAGTLYATGRYSGTYSGTESDPACSASKRIGQPAFAGIPIAFDALRDAPDTEEDSENAIGLSGAVATEMACLPLQAGPIILGQAFVGGGIGAAAPNGQATKLACANLANPTDLCPQRLVPGPYSTVLNLTTGQCAALDRASPALSCPAVMWCATLPRRKVLALAPGRSTIARLSYGPWVHTDTGEPPSTTTTSSSWTMVVTRVS